jgi:hypothetical protein
MKGGVDVVGGRKRAPILRAADWYHTGVVVPRLEEAMADAAEYGGYRWMIPLSVDMGVWTEADGAVEVGLRFAYSLDAPHLEFVQEIPATPWAWVPGRAVHHLGYWVDDLSVASAALAARGHPVEVCGGSDPEHPTQFTYHLGADGIRIELVDRTMVPDWAGFLASFTPPEA